MDSEHRRCYIHVGLPKTGTTYLQDALWASPDALARQGVQMLPARRRDHFQLTLALRGVLDSAMDPPEAYRALDRLAEEAASAARPNAALSQEALAPATPAQARRLVELLPGFEAHVVITARDLARQLPSAWQQRIKGRQVHSYPDFLQAVVDRSPLANDFWINQDLPDVAARWATAVPAGRVHVVTVPGPDVAPGLLLERFCSVLEISAESLTAETPRSNPSLGLVQAELLRRVNVALGDRLPHARAGYGRVGAGYLANRILASQRGAPPRVPAALADWCQQTSTTWVETLRSAGYDIVGDLGDLMPSPDRAADQTVTESAIAASAAAALADVLELRASELDELDLLRERLRTKRARPAAQRPLPRRRRRERQADDEGRT